MTPGGSATVLQVEPFQWRTTGTPSDPTVS